MRKLETPARQFGYLRKVNHFIFEEMILAALEEAGFAITHNQRYTGDGGIDGRFQLAGQEVLIQAKRYRHHIRAADVKEFAEVCHRHQLKGIFVHTGRTGKLANEIGRSVPSVDIVSGQRMLNLLTGSEFYPMGTKGNNVAALKAS
ncbi:restriction endonuclease [Marinimicrobium sp. ABcell2]|uniref:restriction endonuclease n=1 Tax=Marinimicrobium sp. ABcell2 TaxID=3069751 RepID=UPI0027B69BDB|nr:restriction endonuclease [Marinimicrobium sp. ABcell2]MDQ2077461.1 restriction endonuclease [Marinimicrobium sp. ABcell2]